VIDIYREWDEGKGRMVVDTKELENIGISKAH
jgi:hypothetical protein